MALDYLTSAWEQLQDSLGDNKGLVALSGAGALVLLGSLFTHSSKNSRRHRLTGGGISADQVEHEFSEYSAAYGKEAGEGITDRSRTSQLVDTFYNLVTGTDPLRTSLLPLYQTLTAGLPVLVRQFDEQAFGYGLQTFTSGVGV